MNNVIHSFREKWILSKSFRILRCLAVIALKQTEKLDKMKLIVGCAELNIDNCNN